MKSVRTKFLVLTLAALAASGCGIFKKGTPKTPVLGDRVAVLEAELDAAEERWLVTRDELCDRLCVLFGGRSAEELVCHDVSTGAENDLEQASEV